MNFWDSSAVLPILISEAASEQLKDIFRKDTTLIVWWATEVECTSALSRRERETSSSASVIEEAFLRLNHLKTGWHEVQPAHFVRTTATRLLRTHALRAADALQLAAAIFAAEGNPSTLSFICLDERLRAAAEKEGFRILPI